MFFIYRILPENKISTRIYKHIITIVDIPILIFKTDYLTENTWLRYYPRGPKNRLDASIELNVLPQTAFNLFIVAQFLWGPLVMITEKRFNKNTILDFFVYGLYSLSWVPIAAVGIAKKNQREWFHTQHTQSISIAEMQ